MSEKGETFLAQKIVSIGMVYFRQEFQKMLFLRWLRGKPLYFLKGFLWFFCDFVENLYEEPLCPLVP